MECGAEYEMEYICNDCGAIFEKPAELEETSWAWGRPEEYICLLYTSDAADE